MEKEGIPTGDVKNIDKNLTQIEKQKLIGFLSVGDIPGILNVIRQYPPLPEEFISSLEVQEAAKKGLDVFSNIYPNETAKIEEIKRLFSRT